MNRVCVCASKGTYSTAEMGRGRCQASSFTTSRSSSCKHSRRQLTPVGVAWTRGRGLTSALPAEPGSRPSSACRRPGSSRPQTRVRPAGGPALRLRTSGGQGRRRDDGSTDRQQLSTAGGLTHRSGSVDDGGDRRQGPGVSLQALVGPLRSKVSRGELSCRAEMTRVVKGLKLRSPGQLTRP